jgi:hypothetical protein
MGMNWEIEADRDVRDGDQVRRGSARTRGVGLFRSLFGYLFRSVYLAGVIAAGLFTVNAVAAGTSTDPAIQPRINEPLPVWRTNFAAYLTNRSWIAEMEVDLSNNRHWPLGSKPGEHGVWPTQYVGYTTWKCSIQPGGFFVSIGTNTPVKAWQGGLVYGESESNYWSFSTMWDLAFVSKYRELGWTVNNYLEQGTVMKKQDILTVLNLGIFSLDRETIQWNGPDQFTAGMLSWDGKPTRYKIQVKIEEYSPEGFPSRLRYWPSHPIWERDATNEEFVVHCQYDQPTLPPSQETIQIFVNGKRQREDIGGEPWTNNIRRITFGLRPGTTERGFLPSMFVPQDYTVKRILVLSNDLRYEVQPDGRMVCVEFEKEDFSEHRHSRLTFIKVFVVLIGITISIVFLVRKKRGAD